MSQESGVVTNAEPSFDILIHWVALLVACQIPHRRFFSVIGILHATPMPLQKKNGGGVTDEGYKSIHKWLQTQFLPSPSVQVSTMVCWLHCDEEGVDYIRGGVAARSTIHTHTYTQAGRVAGSSTITGRAVWILKETAMSCATMCEVGVQ